MNPALVGRQDRTRRAADAHGGHVQQPRQRQHQRLQEGPRGVRGPAVPERAPGRRRDLAGHAGAVGRAPRHRRARGRHRKDLHAGRTHADRQRAGRGHRRPRLLPGADARRHQRLHARRQLPAVAAGPAGDLERLRACSRASPFPTARRASPSAATASSACSSPASRRRCRSARCSSPTSSIRPACSRAARTCCVETTASGPAQSGTPGQNGLGTTTQGNVEASNVNVVEELVNMIETQRAYEMNSKAISTTDQMLQYVNNNL